MRKFRKFPTRFQTSKLLMKGTKASMSSVFAQPIAESDLEPITIARGDSYEVQLVPVPKDAPATFQGENAADILCIDINKFGVDDAVRWVNASSAVFTFGKSKVRPVIIIMGPSDKLGSREMAAMSEKLGSKGVRFHRWPKGCDSSADAFKALGEKLAGRLQGVNVGVDAPLVAIT